MKRNKAHLPRNRTHSTGVWSLSEIHVSAPTKTNDVNDICGRARLCARCPEEQVPTI